MFIAVFAAFYVSLWPQHRSVTRLYIHTRKRERTQEKEMSDSEKEKNHRFYLTIPKIPYENTFQTAFIVTFFYLTNRTHKRLQFQSKPITQNIAVDPVERLWVLTKIRVFSTLMHKSTIIPASLSPMSKSRLK